MTSLATSTKALMPMFSVSIAPIQAGHQSQAGFYRLPREIRDQIYNKCLCSSKIRVEEQIPSNSPGLKASLKTKNFDMRRSLSLVSRQFYLDITEEFLKRTDCHIDGDEAFEDEDPAQYINKVSQAVKRIYPTSSFGFDSIQRISITWDSFPIDASGKESLSTMLKSLSSLTSLTQLSLNFNQVARHHTTHRTSKFFIAVESGIREGLATSLSAKNICVSFGWLRPERKTLKMSPNVRVHRNARQLQADRSLEYTDEMSDGMVSRFTKRCPHCNDKRVPSTAARTKRIMALSV